MNKDSSQISGGQGDNDRMKIQGVVVVTDFSAFCGLDIESKAVLWLQVCRKLVSIHHRHGLRAFISSFNFFI